MSSRINLAALARRGALNISNAVHKIRAGGKDTNAIVADALKQVQDAVNRLEAAVSQSAEVERVEIDGADIRDLRVGGEDGPGIFEIFSGPPSYTRIGRDGTESSGTAVTITSCVNAVVTCAAAHGVEVGDIVHIVGTTSIAHLGYWEVSAVTSSTIYEIANPPTATGTGGTSTRQFGGGWRRQFAIGGTDQASAPFWSTPLGVAKIGKNGAIELLDSLGASKGFIGVTTETAKNIATAVDNGSGKIRVGITAHGYSVGDDVVLVIPGVLSAATDASVTAVPTANTFDVDVAFAGAYTTGGTAKRYYGPVWAQTLRAGGTGGHANARFKTFRDGSMLIGLASGARLVITASGSLQIVDGTISLTDNGADFKVEIDATNGLKVTQISTGDYAQIKNGLLTVRGALSVDQRVSIDRDSINLTNPTKEFISISIIDTSGAEIRLADTSANVKVIIDSITGKVDAQTFAVNGTAGVNASHNVVTALTTATLQYKDWAGANQSTTIVTGGTTVARAWTKGILTT